MVAVDLVADVNSKLRDLHTKAVNEREHPLLIAMLEQMIRVTNTDAQIAAETAEPQKSNEREPLREAPVLSKENCPHKNINIYGICQDCATCMHTQNDGEVCRTCGEPINVKPTDFRMTEKTA